MERRTYELIGFASQLVRHWGGPVLFVRPHGVLVSASSYHLTVKAVSRSAGRSAVAASAYRSGTRLIDTRTGLVYDYRRRTGVVVAELILPPLPGVPGVASPKITREQLWNFAEASERRKDGVTAREIEIALPAELPPVARLQLAHDFARDVASRYGVVVDLAIHLPGMGDARNHHAHMLLTTRTLLGDGAGLGGKSALELSNGDRKKLGLCSGPDEIVRIRKSWADFENAALAKHGLDFAVTHLSLKDQDAAALPSLPPLPGTAATPGVAALPGLPAVAALPRVPRVPQIHLGVACAAMERRGVPTRRGERLAEIMPGHHLLRVAELPGLAIARMVMAQLGRIELDLPRLPKHQLPRPGGHHGQQQPELPRFGPARTPKAIPAARLPGLPGPPKPGRRSLV